MRPSLSRLGAPARRALERWPPAWLGDPEERLDPKSRRCGCYASCIAYRWIGNIQIRLEGEVDQGTA